MKVIYTAPNRGHHYRYALAMHKAGILSSFISGFSRFSPRAKLDQIGAELYRADLLQTLYLAGLKIGLPTKISSHLAYLSKIEQDLACKKFLKNVDIFMFYNGSGLYSGVYAKKRGIITIVEAVNSHVDFQEHLLQDEYKRLNLTWKPFHEQEKIRRMKEYELADYILLPSDFVKDSFLKLGFPEKKLLKVPYGFNQLLTNTIDEYTQSHSKEFTILYVGSISIRKGVRYLIQAFTKFKHPRKKLVLVGPRSQLDGLHDLYIPPEVVFTGILKGEALQKAYATANIFCLPSIEEGLALVLGEALSFGLPIIATTNTGASDIITDGQEGFLVPIRDYNSIFEKIQLLADNTELYQGMKFNAELKSKKLHGWDESGRLLVSTLINVNNKNLKPISFSDNE